MEPETLCSNSPSIDIDKKNLEQLLETFGSMVTLDDIASAYHQSDHNLCTAMNILGNKQRGTSKSSTLTSEEEVESTYTSLVCPSDNYMEIAEDTKSKPRKSPACMGTISSVIGKGYVVPKTSTNGSCKPRPLKLNSDDIPMSEIWDGKDFPNSTKQSDTMHHNIEEFLFKMLGEGFSLNKSEIHNIVGQCGYDVTESMDKLLDLSASTLGKSDDILKVSSEKYSGMGSIEAEDQFLCTYSGSLNLRTRNAKQLLERKEKHDLQKEILHAMFTAPERSEKEPKKHFPIKEVRRSLPPHKVVEEPLKETKIEYRPVIRTKQVSENTPDTEEIEDSYDVLRKAVKEYWATMREYYKAAADAFAEEDNERAHKLMEEGHFFMKKAREADEKSAEKLLESNDEEEIIPFDMRDFEPKAAVRFLKVQLTSLSGNPSFKYLKVIAGSNDEISRSRPRKRLIVKFLERENIKWTEEGDGWTIVIQTDVIDPKKLSFAKKQAAIL